MNAITKATGIIVLVTAGFFAVQAGTALAAPPSPETEVGIDPCLLIDCGPIVPDDDDGLEVFPIDPCILIECPDPEPEAPTPTEEPAPQAEPEDPPADDGGDPVAPAVDTDPTPVVGQVSADGATGADTDSPDAAQANVSDDDGSFWSSPLMVAIAAFGIVGLVLFLLVMARRRSEEAS